MFGLNVIFNIGALGLVTTLSTLPQTTPKIGHHIIHAFQITQFHSKVCFISSVKKVLFSMFKHVLIKKVSILDMFPAFYTVIATGLNVLSFNVIFNVSTLCLIPTDHTLPLSTSKIYHH